MSVWRWQGLPCPQIAYNLFRALGIICTQKAMIRVNLRMRFVRIAVVYCIQGTFWRPPHIQTAAASNNKLTIYITLWNFKYFLYIDDKL